MCVLIICILVFTVFCIVCIVFFVIFLLCIFILNCFVFTTVRTDLQEVGCGYVEWIGLANGRDRWRTLVSAVMNLRVP
jgi:hypothetical protein